MDSYRQSNLAYWESVVSIHLASAFYRADAFRQGANVLDSIEREFLGDIRGKRLLHLQCHFGLDTLSCARLGADVTGVDFSPRAIETARALASETRLSANFLEGDATDPPIPPAAFDIVFASWGAIMWIEDMNAWMRAAAKALVPGGRLLLIDGHPVTMMMDEHVSPTSPFTVRYPYQLRIPEMNASERDYADPSIRVEGKTFIWLHGIGEILSAAIAAGFEIRVFKELDRVPWEALPQLVKRDEVFWSLPDGAPFLPLAFALDARRVGDKGR